MTKKSKKTSSTRKIIVLLIIILNIFALSWIGWQSYPIVADYIRSQNINLPSIRPASQKNDQSYLEYDFSKVNRNFKFKAQLPINWRTEYIQSTNAVNIYDPASIESNNFDKSQILVSFYLGNDFRPLSNYEIKSESSRKVESFAAQEYAGLLKAPQTKTSQWPKWIQSNHKIITIKTTSAGSITFYSFAKRPDMPDSVFNKFLDGVKTVPASDKNSPDQNYSQPIPNFAQSVTLKKYGDYITPQTSPVQPERFTGYHTGVDIEVEDKTASVPVQAIADGEVVRSNTASGYGGIMVIQHTINGKVIISIYGHLKPSSMLSPKSTVVRGQEIAVLGDNYSAETDSERKHLHFGIYQGQKVDIAGYVKNQDQLKNWLNPLEVIK